MKTRQVLLGWMVLFSLAAALLGEDAPATPAAPAAEKPPGEAPPPGGPPAKPPQAPLGLFLLTGDADFTFTAQRGSRSVFEGAVGPLLLWQPCDRLLLELGLDLSLANNPETGGTDKSGTVALANLSYIVNDRLTVGGGIFEVPFAAFHSHFDASWINRLPDEPLPYGERGIAPDQGIGFFALGAFPIADSRLTYNLWWTVSPALLVDDPDAAGSIDFGNFHNFKYTNRSGGLRTAGGRFAYIVCPAVEVGYSIQASEMNPEHFKHVDALLQAVDVNFVKEFDEIKGTVRAQAEGLWSNVHRATYDPTGALGFGPLRFDNERSGGFGLVSYRPTKCGNAFLKNTEFVIRYDWLRIPEEAPGGGGEERWTPGVDYWITPSCVIKVAYEWDRLHGAPDAHVLLFQFAVGF
jgi:hypothetical protein